MNILIILTFLSKWILICVTVISCSTLLWKILRRKSLHSLFNLGMCFFFFLTGTIFPFLVTEYANLLSKMIKQEAFPSPDSCHRLYLYRMLIGQGMKVFFLNLIYRYIIIRFSHYGQGLSHSISHGGTNHRVLKITYFTFLLSYMVISFLPRCLKSFKGDGMERIVKGRICLLLRCKC